MGAPYARRSSCRKYMCVAVAPTHRFARSRSLTLAKVATEPLIAYSRAAYPEYHAALEGMFAPVERRPVIAGELDSVTSLIAAVEAGRGIALVPNCMACLAGPRLRIIPLVPASSPIIVGAVCRNGTTSTAVARFVAAAGASGG